MTRSMMSSVGGGVSVVTGGCGSRLTWARRWIQTERSEVDQHLGSAHTEGSQPCNRLYTWRVGLIVLRVTGPFALRTRSIAILCDNRGRRLARGDRGDECNHGTWATRGDSETVFEPIRSTGHCLFGKG